MDALKLKFGGTSTTRLCGLKIRFDSYKICLNRTLKQHLRAMSTMVRELKAAGNTIAEEQKIQVGLRSLLDSWETMVISMTYKENIKTFDDLSRQLELEAERLEVFKATKVAKLGSAYVANNDSRMPIGSRHKNYAPWQDSSNGYAPKKAKNTKCKLGKHSGKGKNGKCFNCNKERHFACDFTKPRKVFPDFNSCKFFVSTHVMVAHSHPCWIVDLEVTEHVTRDRVEFVKHCRIPKGSQGLYMGNGACVKV